MTDKIPEPKLIEVNSHEALLALFGQPHKQSFRLDAVIAHLFHGEQNEDPE
jgi:hypothetical protein